MNRAIIIFVVLGLLVASTTVYAKDRKAEAKALFKQGLSYAEEEDYENAVNAFESSIALYPTKNALYNLATAYQKDKQYTAAIDAFNRLLNEYEGKLKRNMKNSVEVFLEELRDQVGVLRIEVSPSDATITIAGEAQTLSSEGTLQWDPGEIEISASLSGYKTEKRVITVASGALHTLTFSLEPEPMETPPAPEPATIETEPSAAPPADEPAFTEQEPSSNQSDRTLKILGWSSVGIAVASGIATGIFWGFSKSNANDYEDYNDKIESGEISQNDTTSLSKQDAAQDDSKRFGILALGFGAATAVFAATAGTLFIINHKKKNERETVRLQFSPAGVTGSF